MGGSVRCARRAFKNLEEVGMGMGDRVKADVYMSASNGKIGNVHLSTVTRICGHAEEQHKDLRVFRF